MYISFVSQRFGTPKSVLWLMCRFYEETTYQRWRWRYFSHLPFETRHVSKDRRFCYQPKQLCVQWIWVYLDGFQTSVTTLSSKSAKSFIKNSCPNWRDFNFRLRLRPCETSGDSNKKVANDAPPLVWCGVFQNERFHKDSVEPLAASSGLKHAFTIFCKIVKCMSHVDPCWPPRISLILCLVRGIRWSYDLKNLLVAPDSRKSF